MMGILNVIEEMYDKNVWNPAGQSHIAAAMTEYIAWYGLNGPQPLDGVILQNKSSEVSNLRKSGRGEEKFTLYPDAECL